MSIEIRLDHEGKLDEVVFDGENACVHLEQEDDTEWYLGIREGNRLVQVNLFTSRGMIKASYNDDPECF